MRPAAVAGTLAAVLTALALAAVVVVLVTSKLYRVPSSSMEPTLHCKRTALAPGCRGGSSDRVLGATFLLWFRGPRRGDLVAFKTPPGSCGIPDSATFLKRVVAGPGDTVEERLVRGRGFVYVNGRRVEERFVPDGERDTRTYPPTRVPARSYFLLGDNRSSSCDSRDFGAVPRSRIAAIVVATYWPPSRITIR